MDRKRSILHFVTPLKNVSPFDVNMAADAGFDLVVPYADVDLKEIAGLVQDAIFSRAPEDGARTAVLIGGRDPLLAIDMLEAARKAMVPPHFEISVMADPSGAFTTAAGMVAVVERHLAGEGGLAGKSVAVFGATGPVGGVAGLMAAKAGAKVTLVGYDGLHRVAARADQFGERFGVAMLPADGSDETKKEQVVAGTEVVLAAGRAGVQILSAAQLGMAERLKVAVDVNAVPPAGIEGVDAFAQGQPVAGTRGAVGFGALAVGNVKYKAENALLLAMRDATPRRFHGIDAALAAARAQAAAGA